MSRELIAKLRLHPTAFSGRLTKMKTDLAGKVVVVTGSSGAIGAAIALQFAAEGAKLVLHYRTNRTNVEALQRELKRADSIIVRADLTKEVEVRRLFGQTLKRFGRADTLVANAGLWETRDVPVHMMSLRQWQRTLGNAEVVRRVTATMALPKLARPEDIANAAVFYCSDALAGHITGQTLVIAGGMEGRLLWPPHEVDPTLV